MTAVLSVCISLYCSVSANVLLKETSL